MQIETRRQADLQGTVLFYFAFTEFCFLGAGQLHSLHLPRLQHFPKQFQNVMEKCMNAHLVLI